MARVHRLALRLAIAGVFALALIPLLDRSFADAYSTSGWRWCDKWADIRPATQAQYRTYVLASIPVDEAASTWTNVGQFQMGGKVDFDFYFYYQDGSAKIKLYSVYGGQNGTIARAAWSGWPWCFGQGEVEFNTGYTFNPYDTNCQGIPGWYSLKSVALHELGHLVGLNHSGDSYAIMYATIPNCTWKVLGSDDEVGIISIYGRRG